MSSESNVFTGTGDDWHNRALLGYAPDVPWSVYALGYKEAADRLVVGIDSGQQGQDFLVFPILYLYRHYLELSLKANIRMCQVLLAVQRPKVRSHADRIKAAQGHDLAGLWAYLRGLLPGVYPDPPNVYIVGIDRVIQAFSALDPRGDEARYPVDLQDSRTLADLREVNLRQLAVDMARAEEGFTQIEGGIDWEVERREFNAEMDLEMEAELRSWQYGQWTDADDHVD